MRLKVLDRLLIKGFIGPCVLAFFVVEFVLIMQTLWKEIDKIMGKGYGVLDFVELLYYFGLVLIPMALPLTILLSSVMVYGDMAEKYELSSAKSAGVSLVRMLKPGLIAAGLVAVISIVSSNYLRPFAFDGYSSKIKAMKSNKLTFAFDEKIFNNEFKDFAIRIGDKEEDGRTIHDVLIYDYSDNDKSITNVIHAKSGEMYTSPDKRYLIMDLKEGYHFKEIRSEASNSKLRNYKLQGRPVLRYDFTTLRKTFDLEEVLNLSMTSGSYREYEMMNSFELLDAIQGFGENKRLVATKNINKFKVLGREEVVTIEPVDADIEAYKNNRAREEEKLIRTNSKKSPALILQASLPKNISFNPLNITDKTQSLLEILEINNAKDFYEQALKKTLNYKSRNTSNRHDNYRLERDMANYSFALHRMYSWALVCVIFLFIGGPAGAIVRKGGFGYPLLIAIGFYLAFVMTSIIGDKLVKSGSMGPVMGAWLPCLILLPFALYLTSRAMRDNRPIISWRNWKKPRQLTTG